jgi:hypothetical protein
MSTYTHFKGPLQSIPSDSSLGLQYLKSFLPIVDSKKVTLQDVVSPEAVLVSNGSPPAKFTDLLPMFDKRSEMLNHFSHEDHPIEAWDLVGAEGKRTVIFASISK